MEWFTDIASHLSGLPWWAVLIVILSSIACTKGVDALLKYLGFSFEVRKYDNAQKKIERDALVEELKSRIEKLEQNSDKQSEKLDEAYRKLDIATEAHSKCEVEQEKLRGELNVMKEKVARLEDHDKANKKQVEAVKEEIAKRESSRATGEP